MLEVQTPKADSKEDDSMSILAMADYSKSVAEAANIVNGGE